MRKVENKNSPLKTIRTWEPSGAGLQDDLWAEAANTLVLVFGLSLCVLFLPETQETEERWLEEISTPEVS